MATKSYQSKKPLSRKIKEKTKEYSPKVKSAFLAGIAFARAHIKSTPPRKRRSKKSKSKKSRRRRN